jgi:DNA end-binding protein Ku
VPSGKGLVGTTLRYPYEVRDTKEYFDDIPDVTLPTNMLLKLAEQILKSKTKNFDPSQFVDRYEEAVVELLKKKQAGQPVSRERVAPRPQNVVNLMDALRCSIAEEQETSSQLAKRRKPIEGQGEMLLPIAGKAKKGPRRSQGNGPAHDRRMPVDPYAAVAPNTARMRRCRFETPKSNSRRRCH